jgi:predicted nucleic acid-binding protein
LPKVLRYLLDVNILVALLDEDHIHHQRATAWFDTPGLQWAVCPFTEAGFLRYMTRFCRRLRVELRGHDLWFRLTGRHHQLL